MVKIFDLVIARTGLRQDEAIREGYLPTRLRAKVLITKRIIQAQRSAHSSDR